MSELPLQPLIDRLGRMSAALRLAAEVELPQEPRVIAAVEDTGWDALKVASIVTRLIAEDDLWGDLPGLVSLWQDLDIAARAVRCTRPGACDEAFSRVTGTARAFNELQRLAQIVDRAQVALIAQPRDRVADATLCVALSDLESTADRYFMRCLSSPVEGQTDAALAVLTAVAARTARERRLRRRRARGRR